jgi:hypothetical protein
VLRLASVVLLFTFAGNTALPAFFADPESNLPACCRRDGKHHCAMMQLAQNDTSCSFRASRGKCAQFPKSSAVLRVTPATVSAKLAFQGLVAPRIIAGAQPRALILSSSIRSAQKRGPPPLS